jgi:ATP synthase F1 complex assembly factor 2
MQKDHWDPLFAWLKEEYGVELQLAEGFSPARQTEETVRKLREVVEKVDDWELAGEYALGSGMTDLLGP